MTRKHPGVEPLLNAPTFERLPLPDTTIVRQHGPELRQITNTALAGADERPLPASAERFVTLLSIVLAPFRGDDLEDAPDTAQLEQWAEELRAPLTKSARVGAAFAELAQRGDASLVSTSLAVAAYTHTQVGPEHLGIFMNYTAGSSYFLCRTPEARVDDLLPTLQRLLDGYRGTTDAQYQAARARVEAIWHTPMPQVA
jgi:hypothetical protein